MKLLTTTDDSMTEDGSIPSFWYRGYSYSYIGYSYDRNAKLKPYYKPEPFSKWVEDNKTLNRKPILKP